MWYRLARAWNPAQVPEFDAPGDAWPQLLDLGRYGNEIGSQELRQ